MPPSEMYKQVVIDPLLTYVANSLLSCAPAMIVDACASFYTLNEVLRARDTLWKVGDPSILPTYVQRKNAKETEFDKTISDIVKAMTLLDAAAKMPPFALCADTLARIPKAKPREMLPLSVCERLGEVEEKIAALEASLSSARSPAYADAVKTRPSQPGNRRPPNHDASRLQSQPNEHPTAVTAASGSRGAPRQEHPAQETDDDGFTKVEKRRRRPIRVIGTGSSEKLLGAPEPSRDIFIYRVQKTTVKDDIDEYLRDRNITPRAVEKVSHAEARHASFRVELQMKDLKTLLNGEFWPEGVYVRRYYRRSNRDPEETSIKQTSSNG